MDKINKLYLLFGIAEQALAYPELRFLHALALTEIKKLAEEGLAEDRPKATPPSAYPTPPSPDDPVPPEPFKPLQPELTLGVSPAATTPTRRGSAQTIPDPVEGTNP
jgi:hypothetical protein